MWFGYCQFRPERCICTVKTGAPVRPREPGPAKGLHPQGRRRQGVPTFQRKAALFRTCISNRGHRIAASFCHPARPKAAGILIGATGFTKRGPGACSPQPERRALSKITIWALPDSADFSFLTFRPGQSECYNIKDAARQRGPAGTMAEKAPPPGHFDMVQAELICAVVFCASYHTWQGGARRRIIPYASLEREESLCGPVRFLTWMERLPASR